MKKILLIHMHANHKARIIEIAAGGSLHRRLMSMGIREGVEITKLSHIGLRGPVVIKSGRSILALGHGMAAKIIVETE